MTGNLYGELGGAQREVRDLGFDSANPARRYDYWRYGKDNFGPDRESGDRIAAVFPGIRAAVEENRRLLRRAVTYLAEAGARQYLDIGAGLPSTPNVHEIAQDIDPTAHVVYVDHDPVVLAHAQALMISEPRGLVAVVEADLRDPDGLLADVEVRQALDFDQPVALLLFAVLHFVSDAEDPYGIVGRLLRELPSGSYLALSHATFDPLAPAVAASLDKQNGHGTFRARTRSEVEGFLAGLELVNPGLVSTVEWHPDRLPYPASSPQDAIAYAAVGRVP